MGGSRDEDLFKQMETYAKRSRRLGDRTRLPKCMLTLPSLGNYVVLQTMKLEGQRQMVLPRQLIEMKRE